jgi:hypothetical protein
LDIGVWGALANSRNKGRQGNGTNSHSDQLAIRRSVVVIIRDPQGLIGGTARGTATGVDILHEIYFFTTIGIDGNI